jgi:hypothetical protein
VLHRKAAAATTHHFFMPARALAAGHSIFAWGCFAIFCSAPAAVAVIPEMFQQIGLSGKSPKSRQGSFEKIFLFFRNANQAR